MSAEEASETQATSPSSSSEAALLEMSSDDGSSSDEEELSPRELTMKRLVRTIIEAYEKCEDPKKDNTFNGKDEKDGHLSFS